MKQKNVYLTDEQADYLDRHKEFNLSGWLRKEIDDWIEIEVCKDVYAQDVKDYRPRKKAIKKKSTKK
jgi:hypothetical protein